MRKVDIESLLPQREPFLFVDELLSAGMDEIVGMMKYDETFPYYLSCSRQRKIVPGVILIESLVQCGGAGVTHLGITEKALWGLASLEKVQFRGVVEPNTTVKMVVKNLKISNKVLKQTGVSLREGEAILQATWFCLRFK
ncbi:MAG: Beta-hydroxyacyl-(acyl-carrier-protein) dehydratase FabA/FabZ [Anaerosporomusa subterranea]|jgi:3-hydroxyacyl-[acyl-carrier-protein] dehydratase|nr:Beta-hydroxyacyl-(acyl-carrier-protein) dehydratase FabA/FabZ [Anaerosporomusa subterranea]